MEYCTQKNRGLKGRTGKKLLLFSFYLSILDSYQKIAYGPRPRTISGKNMKGSIFHKTLLAAAAFALVTAVYPSGARGAEAAPKTGGILGAAVRAQITPPPGTPLSGYGKLRGKPSRGMHDPIYAQAAALSNGQETFLFMSLDICLIDRSLREAILQQIRTRYDLEPSHFILTATHTHSGSGAYGKRYWQKYIMGKFDPQIFRWIVDQASAAGSRALEIMNPVELEYGESRIDHLIENRMIPKLRYPAELKVLRMKDASGAVRAHLIFMAAHPTLFPAKDTLKISADFPGVIAAQLADRYPGSTAVFINGAAGDLRPHASKDSDKLARMNDFGNAIAGEIMNLSYGAADTSGPWTAVLKDMKLPPVKVRAGWFTVPSLLGGRFFPGHSYFQAVRMGRLAVLAFPGELSSELGFQAENLAHTYNLQPLFAGYANDYIAYVVPRRYYGQRKEYESRVSFYGPDMDWFVLRSGEALIREITTAGERSEIDRPGIRRDEDGLPVLKLYGSSYHRGFEEGRLMRDTIRAGTDSIFAYFRKELKVPLVNRAVINYLGGRAWKQMSPYITYEEYENLRGIADGSGVPLGRLEKLHAMPELFPALCANGAYWGKATAGGKLIALRNLDWNRAMHVQDLAAVKYVVNRAGEDYVNIGYAGFEGVLSGMNEEGVSVGQIGAVSSDETMKGVPMPFLLKRILEESAVLDDAKSIFERSDLTRGYNYVIAGAKEKQAFAAEATATKLAFFDANDPKEALVPYAVPVEDAVLRADPALDPAIRDLQKASGGKPKKPGLEPPAGSAYEIRYRKHAALVLENYGRLTPEKAEEIAGQIAPRSNIQSVIYAFPDIFVANARGEQRAADSGYRHLNFEELRGWNEKAG